MVSERGTVNAFDPLPRSFIVDSKIRLRRVLPEFLYLLFYSLLLLPATHERKATKMVERSSKILVGCTRGRYHQVAPAMSSIHRRYPLSIAKISVMRGGVSAIARPRDFRGRPPRASITRAHPSSAPLHMSTRLHESSVTVKSIATRVGIASFCFSRFLPSRL